MRLLVLPALAFVLTATNAPAEVPVETQPLDNPVFETPPKKWQSLEEFLATQSTSNSRLRQIITSDDDCRDSVTQVRSEAGLPELNRIPASPDLPHLIYAVDRREAGCSVMVMKSNPDDVRQLPLPAEGPMRIPTETSDE